MRTAGFDKPLYILPFDHRGSFQTKMFGWKGTLTLELNNLTRVPIKLYPGLPIAQLSFMTLDTPALRPYGHEDLGSHYQGQVDATESRYGARA